MNTESNELKEKGDPAQQELVDFLQADLDLCFTMLKTSVITSDPVHHLTTSRHVSEGLRIIQKRLDRIEDPQAQKAIHKRTDELEKAVEMLDENHSARQR